MLTTSVDNVPVISHIHTHLIWQCPICVGLYDMGLHLFGYDLADTMCNKVCQNPAVRYHDQLLSFHRPYD